jgi:hypothetical protein
MQRHAAGAIALLLLIGSGLLFAFHPTWDETQAFASSSLRMGAVLGAIWLAYPELIRLPKWLVPLILGTVVAIAVRPKSALYVVPIVLMILILRPKKKRTSTVDTRRR